MPDEPSIDSTAARDRSRARGRIANDGMLAYSPSQGLLGVSMSTEPAAISPEQLLAAQLSALDLMGGMHMGVGFHGMTAPGLADAASPQLTTIPSLHSLILGGLSSPSAAPTSQAAAAWALLRPQQPLQLPAAAPAGRRHEEKVRRTVYISDIDPEVTEAQLAAFFVDRGGQLVDCRMCGDPNTSNRFAFIEFLSEAEALQAQALTGCLLGANPIRVSPSKTAIVPVNNTYLPRSAGERERVARTIYVANLDRGLEAEAVRLYFERLCGPVSRLRVLGDAQHNAKIAFVEFASAACAEAALRCSGALLGALPIRVSPSKTPVRCEPAPRSGGSCSGAAAAAAMVAQKAAAAQQHARAAAQMLHATEQQQHHHHQAAAMRQQSLPLPVSADLPAQQQLRQATATRHQSLPQQMASMALPTQQHMAASAVAPSVAHSLLAATRQELHNSTPFMLPHSL